MNDALDQEVLKRASPMAGPPSRLVAFFKRDIAERKILFGIVLPIVCFLLEPWVSKVADIPFAGWGTRSLAFVEVLALSLWLSWKNELGRWSAIFAGIFAFGYFFSLVYGLFLIFFIPFGVVFYGTGLLGLTPWFTAVIYRSCFFEAEGQSRHRGWRKIIFFILGFHVPPIVFWSIHFMDFR